MGQYHKLVNLDKKEVLDPHGIGLFSKQYEHTGVEGSLADALYLLVMSSPASGGGDWPLSEASGRWCGDRVVVLGDYTTNGSIPGYEDNAENLYSESRDWFDVAPLVRNALEKTFLISYRVTTKSFPSGEEYESVEREML